ncbi:MAG: hemerythrin domain-containing protein [Dehalococcoidales bacterium]|nr:hemerythrin domain-containing protein [Dehalococcoidales bacterium]
MKPIGPLMREHRLIEKMVGILADQLKPAGEGRNIDARLVVVAVDFFRTYADHTHHGKEEDILFRELAKRQLSPEDKKTMEELVQEHIEARKMVTALYEANKTYSASGSQESSIVTELVAELVRFYPKHIAKEDQKFFYPCLAYLTKEEQDGMLKEFREFDRKLIHEKYQTIVEEVASIGKASD